MLVIFTIQAQILNFKEELDQYLRVLAVNKGSLAGSLSAEAKAELDLKVTYKETWWLFLKDFIFLLNQPLLKNKVHMARDISLSWRLSEFMNEIGDDCAVIDTSVAIMVMIRLFFHLYSFLFEPLAIF